MLSKLSSFTQETFSGVSVIKSYSLEPVINEKFDALAGDAKSTNMNLVKVQAWFFPLMILLIGLSNLIVIYVGGNQYINNEIEFGVLAEFIIYINMLTWPVAVVGWITSVVQQAEASQKRINTFLNEVSKIKDGNGVYQTISGAITFNAISLTYHETKIEAVKKLSFTVEPNKTLGIIGNVGSGKSSVLNLINRLYDPTSGSITLDQLDLKDFKLEELRSLIGYVPQNAFLFSESIEQNIKFGKVDATKEELIEAAKNGCVHENIIAFKKGYQTLLGERGITLSGGQIQRIAIARALIKNSKILMFDDCLSAVDTDTEEQILNNLKHVCKDKTTIIVSHRISSLKNADTIMVMDKGALLETGTHNELMALKGYYFELFKKQQHEK